MGDTESCSSRAFLGGWNENRKQRIKVEVYNEVLSRLRELNVPEAALPGFEDELWTHFYRLPTRYALDMNVERAQDVLMHKRLLHMARAPATRPAVEVRLVQVRSASGVNRSNFLHSNSQQRVCTQDSAIPGNISIHPPPAFGSSANFQLALEVSQSQVIDGRSNLPFYTHYSCPMHEITISTIDRTKLLSQLTSLLSETGLNIQEAHAFSTLDGYSLDVFVVGGWAVEETEKLKHVLTNRIQENEINFNHLCLDENGVFLAFLPTSFQKSIISKIFWVNNQKQTLLKENGSLPTAIQEQTGINYICNHINRGNEVWEIDASCLKYEMKIASSSFSDLYKGSFHNHDVAIKVLKTENLNESIQKEFAQEVYILSKILHKNIVQFVGASTKPPNLFIVTEYMSGGNMYHFLHKQKAVLTLPSLLKVAIDVSEGMSYLHQNNILHRDLKAANLLIDEKGVVKVADFGVARMQDQSGIMTAETGTYRWMAPEVIEHKPYDHKADVFSFGIVLWELLTGKLPYEHLSPLQAAVGVVQKGLRPKIPRHTHLKIVELLHRCWHQDPSLRPEFAEILEFLQRLVNGVAGAVEGEERAGYERT